MGAFLLIKDRSMADHYFSPSFRKSIQPFLYLFPAAFFLLVFTYYPILRAFYISLFQWSTDYPQKVFNGLRNYSEILREPLFWKVTLNTFLYSVSTICAGMILGLVLAVQVNKRIKLGGFFKASLFYPTLIPMAAAGLIWLWIYAPTYGLLDNFLRRIGLPSMGLLLRADTALWCVALVAVWKHVGYYMILFLAGLQNIPTELLDVATLEGAGNWRKFRSVTFPLLSSYTFFIFIINIVDSLQSIDLIYIMTQGKPAHASNLFVYYIYQQAFRFWNMGMGSTLTAILTLFLLACVVAIFSTIGRRVYYEV
jgi:ABC-type sugar transport system permease subunit